MMIANAQVTEHDLRQSVNQRAQAAKDYLIETGNFPAERVFLPASGINAEGVKDNGKLARVDFLLK
jgi:hypothetical protein